MMRVGLRIDVCHSLTDILDVGNSAALFRLASQKQLILLSGILPSRGTTAAMAGSDDAHQHAKMPCIARWRPFGNSY